VRESGREGKKWKKVWIGGEERTREGERGRREGERGIHKREKPGRGRGSTVHSYTVHDI